ncbi:MAG: DNA mismatch endonuclease Vsr [Sporocytophaga sp.]|uniref:very short patch repair endonuclease n=1 Tax=Sporocytophaga sp. TaxID=2231183 RepID=UPI001B1B580C|nr:very short patch repair endonuclease [Sporocytophaga sp.]MBO9703673.1 DNA mismatch endonuclease Vsr [Sporocytophaga sp.]
MSDQINISTRSFNMSQIKGKNTKPEILVRKFLFSKGLRYRLNSRNLPGKPDIVLAKYNTVIFVNGCFWHGHAGCKYFTIPKTRTEWWREKINKNMERDKKVIKELNERGWIVNTIWQCELKVKNKEKALNDLLINILKYQ